MHTFEETERLVSKVAAALRKLGGTVATAESCTGGLIAKLLTDVPGSSSYFVEGVVAYSNESKTRLLGVTEELIARHGAVSREVAQAMARGCRQKAGTDYAVATTGIAGPTGGSEEKPVGLVYLALADETCCDVAELRLDEHLSRAEIRRQAADAMFQQLLRKLQQCEQGDQPTHRTAT